MHRIEGENYLDVGGLHYFTEGPPGTTIVDDWLNAVQEEILKVITDAGLSAKTASSETRDQLAEAILNRNVDFIMASQKGLDFSAALKGTFDGPETEMWELDSTFNGSGIAGGAASAAWVLGKTGLEVGAALPLGGGIVNRQQDNGGDWVFGFKRTGYYVVAGHTLTTNTVGAESWHQQQIYTSGDDGVTYATMMYEMSGNNWAAAARSSCGGIGQFKVTDITKDVLKWVSSPTLGTSNNGLPRLVFMKVGNI